MEPDVATEILQDVLRTVFKRDSFRAQQLETVQEVLRGRDLLVVLPTGHGKSLTYQLPAVVQNQEQRGGGFYLVVSPLLALIRDQVTSLQSLGIAAESINSTTPAYDRERILSQFARGDGSLLYVSPEQCLSPKFRSFINSLEPSQIRRLVVDEAHCAVEWGSDFRKDYARLGTEFREVIGKDVPVMALTGTAPPQLQKEIIRTLGLCNARVFQTSSRRPHLHYEVRYIEDAGDRLVDVLRFLKMYRGRISHLASSTRGSNVDSAYPGCGIIYCRSRASTETIAYECNRELGQCAAAYHAGLSTTERNNVMEQWINGNPNYAVVVATVAFGLGVDKPDTRFVIHFDFPQNLEGYVQQTGRAGRDRKAARCILYYSMEETQRVLRFAKDRKDRSSTLALLNFATTVNKCRHFMLSEYYDDPDNRPTCEYACDFCKMPRRLRQRYEDWQCQFE